MQNLNRLLLLLWLFNPLFALSQSKENLYLKFHEKNGRIGLIDKPSGKTIIKSQYSKLAFIVQRPASENSLPAAIIISSMLHNDTFPATQLVSKSIMAEKRSGWGLVDLENKVLLPFLYDSIESYELRVSHNPDAPKWQGYRIFKNGNYGFSGYDGKLLIEPVLNFHDNENIFAVRKKGSINYSMLMAVGKECTARSVKCHFEQAISYLIDPANPEAGTIDTIFVNTPYQILPVTGQLNLLDLQTMTLVDTNWWDDIIIQQKKTDWVTQYSFKDSNSTRYKRSYSRMNYETDPYLIPDTLQFLLTVRKAGKSTLFFPGEKTCGWFDSIVSLVNQNTANLIFKAYKNNQWNYHDAEGTLLAEGLQAEHTFGCLTNTGNMVKIAVVQKDGAQTQVKFQTSRLLVLFIDPNDPEAGTVERVTSDSITTLLCKGGKINIMNMQSGELISKEWFDDVGIITKPQIIWPGSQYTEILSFGLNDFDNLVCAYNHQSDNMYPYFLVKKEDKWGLMDINGKLTIPVNYDTLTPVFSREDKVYGFSLITVENDRIICLSPEGKKCDN